MRKSDEEDLEVSFDDGLSTGDAKLEN